MVYAEKYFIRTWEKWIFCCFGVKCPKISIESMWSNVSFQVSVSLLIFCQKIYPLMSMRCKNPLLWLLTVVLSLFVHQDLLYTFRCSFVGCINIYEGYILMLDCSLCHHMTCFVSYKAWRALSLTCFVPKSILDDTLFNYSITTLRTGLNEMCSRLW